MNEETLVDYLEDRLSNRERARVEACLSESDSSLEALTLFEEAGREDNFADLQTVPDHVTANVLQTVLSLREETFFGRVAAIIRDFGAIDRAVIRRLFPWKRMRFATVRGSKGVIDANLMALKASFSEFDIQVEVDKIRPETVNLKVFLLEDSKTVKAARATLIKNEREMASYLFKSSEAFFEDVPFGRYTLVIAVNGNEKGRYAFEIKESRHGREKKP